MAVLRFKKNEDTESFLGVGGEPVSQRYPTPRMMKTQLAVADFLQAPSKRASFICILQQEPGF